MTYALQSIFDTCAEFKKRLICNGLGRAEALDYKALN